MTMKIRSIRSRAAVVVAAAAIVTAGLSGTASAASAGPAPHQPNPVPAPYPGAVAALNPGAGAVLPAPPSAPVASSGTLLLAGCTPYVDGDHAHVTSGQVSVHGWWYRGTCANTKTTVSVGLQEYYSDKTWRTKATGSANVWPGGGSANWANARHVCESTVIAAWRSYIIVKIGNGASAYTTGQNLACRTLT
jgi:hypothetical protein